MRELIGKMLPVGVEDFERMRQDDYYYVDKTGLIRELLQDGSVITLFTRPRRFGKSLNMSMLRYFFEVGGDPHLFDGLAIAQEKALCEKYQGKFPVISVSLKDVDGLCYADAEDRLREIVQSEVQRHMVLLNSDRLDETEKAIVQEFRRCKGDLHNALKKLSELLAKHYNSKVVILIDEYDVPLDKAFHHGYYNEMVALIRQLLSSALKTNPNLQMAVLTDCMRVSKESIFTGLNNLKVRTITDETFNEWFGFTDEEVRAMLAAYNAEDRLELTRSWYDGYHFGDKDIYCPWDIINWCSLLRGNRNAEPEDFWINTSGNDMVRRFVDRADDQTQEEIERLVAGEQIAKRLRLDLTYGEMDKTIDNLWSVLFTTGYLTQSGKTEDGRYLLRIPNREVHEVFVLQIQEWFSEKLQSDGDRLRQLRSALENGDVPTMEELLNGLLGETISVLDAKAPRSRKENFYHGLLLGMLSGRSGWRIRSNAEAGDGFAGILLFSTAKKRGILIEVKCADTYPALPAAAEAALRQIEDRNYKQALLNEGIEDITAYGIAFFKKTCKVLKAPESGA